MFTTQYVGSCYIKNGVYKMPPQGSAGRTAGLDGARQGARQGSAGGSAGLDRARQGARRHRWSQTLQGHNSALGCPFGAILFLKPLISSRSIG